MPRFLEAILEKAAQKKGVKDKDAYVYGTMNNLGYMRGSKETAKGKAAERKHREGK